MSRINIPLPVNELVARYEAGESAPTLARAYGVGAGTVGRRLKGAGVTMRMRGGPPGNNKGHKPGGPLFEHMNGYPMTYDRDGKQCRIHRACWEAYHGPIPSGHLIHHTNGDRADTRIENLACMPHAEHTRLHCQKEATDGEA